MNAPRVALLALCVLLPAVTFRLGGSTLWVVQAIGCAVTAGLAVWLLHDDGLLRGAFQHKAGDPTIALVAALCLFGATVLAVNHWLAPEPYLHVCGPRGVWVPRHGAAGLARAAEWLRQRACEAHFRSAGLRGPLRAVAIVLIAAAEEVAWRGGVQQVLSERLGSVRGWVAASVLFGLAHLGTGNAAVGLLALAGGFLWGAIFLWRGRLLPAVLSHAVFSFALFYQNSPFVIRYETFH
jgi:membrane protease YdiL (CAAX protease family)